MQTNNGVFQKLFGLVAFGILLFWGLQNIEELFSLLGVLLGLILPFLVGLGIAFILNVPMRFIETKLLGKITPKNPRVMNKLRRPLSLLLAIALVVGVVVFVMLMIMPQIISTVKMLGESIPQHLVLLQQWAKETFVQYPGIADWLTGIKIDWDQLGNLVFGYVKTGAGNVLSRTFSAAASIFSGLFSFFLGTIFAIYVLAQKENLARQIKKLLAAFLPEKRVAKILDVALLSERTFSHFLSGQCIEAVVLGTMFFVSLWLLRFPYALLISVTIAFFALIPLFGAFIGCAVGAFLILMVDPMQALWFIVLFLVLQQIEGNFIYPRVVGSSVGLPAIWVLVAVTIGGSTMGVLGMLINIPLCSVLYSLLRDEGNRRLREKEPLAPVEES